MDRLLSVWGLKNHLYPWRDGQAAVCLRAKEPPLPLEGWLGWVDLNGCTATTVRWLRHYHCAIAYCMRTALYVCVYKSVYLYCINRRTGFCFAVTRRTVWHVCATTRRSLRESLTTSRSTQSLTSCWSLELIRMSCLSILEAPPPG